jgi:hypothetical protein
MTISTHTDPNLNFLDFRRTAGAVSLEAHGQATFMGASLTFNLAVDITTCTCGFPPSLRP